MTLVRTQPERRATFAWLRCIAINEAYRLSDIDRRDARLEHLAADWQQLMTDPMTSTTGSGRAKHYGLSPRCPSVNAATSRCTSPATPTARSPRYRGRTYTNVAKTLRKAEARIRLQQMRTARFAAPRRARPAGGQGPGRPS